MNWANEMNGGEFSELDELIEMASGGVSWVTDLDELAYKHKWNMQNT